MKSAVQEGAMTDARSAEETKVAELGQAIGFGRLMNLASRLWGINLAKVGLSGGGALVVGPCASMMESCRNCLTGCAVCGGTGLVTKRVNELVAESHRLSQIVSDLTALHEETRAYEESVRGRPELSARAPLPEGLPVQASRFAKILAGSGPEPAEPENQ